MSERLALAGNVGSALRLWRGAHQNSLFPFRRAFRGVHIDTRHWLRRQGSPNCLADAVKRLAEQPLDPRVSQGSQEPAPLNVKAIVAGCIPGKARQGKARLGKARQAPATVKELLKFFGITKHHQLSPPLPAPLHHPLTSPRSSMSTATIGVTRETSQAP